MHPVKNVVTGVPDVNINAPRGREHQINSLPAAYVDHHTGMPMIISRWQPTPEERLLIAGGGDVYLMVLSAVMVPVLLMADPPILIGLGENGRVLTVDHPEYAGMTAPPGIAG